MKSNIDDVPLEYANVETIATTATEDVSPAEQKKDCCGNPAGNPNESQVLFIRFAAVFCLIFGLTEIGLGSFVYDYLRNYKAGSWWSALVVVITGALGLISTTRLTTICTLTFAILAVIISVIGAAIDGSVATSVRSLTACAYQSSFGASMKYYGEAKGFAKVNTCIDYLAPDYCYCTNNAGSFCGTYGLSTSSMNSGRTCGDILTSYPSAVSASAALCATSAAAVLIIAIFACCGICCSDRQMMGDTEPARSSDNQPAFGVASSEVKKSESV